MPDTHKDYATSKNISLVASIGSSQVSYGTAAGSVAYEGRFAILGGEFL
jgi:hypothetical protein